ncbi:MAG: HNH endonuclease [Parvularculaceae bacterium]
MTDIDLLMKRCIYCDQDKPETEFSLEHIWPDSLGGDYLPAFWQTDDVCARCNNLSGLFVDGAFIKSFAGMAEKVADADRYQSLTSPRASPLAYTGRITTVPAPAGCVAEMWVGACGANMIHIRPQHDETWSGYVSGDPKAKKAAAGRVYIALTSKEMFWVNVALKSFLAHFKRSERFLINGAVQAAPGEPPLIATLDRKATAPEDLAVIDAVLAAGRSGAFLKNELIVRTNPADRFLPKLGIAIGYQLFGAPYLDTPYVQTLRRALWERADTVRETLPVVGVGYFAPKSRGLFGDMLKWPGGWVLLIKRQKDGVMLSVVTPSGRGMQGLISDDPALMAGLSPDYDAGSVWITVPPLSEAVGPIGLPDYLAHKLGNMTSPELAALEGQLIDPATLPACR